MKRLARTLIDAVTVMSLVVVFAAVGLWARSYWVCDGIRWGSADGRTAIGLQAARGRVAFETDSLLESAKGQTRNRSVQWSHESLAFDDWEEGWNVPLDQHYSLLGFAFMSCKRYSIIQTEMYVLPLWCVAVLTAILPGRRIFGILRPPTAAGHCPSCGYDLRATPSRCPECGLALAPKVHSNSVT